MSRFRVATDFIADGLVDDFWVQFVVRMRIDVLTDGSSCEVRSSNLRIRDVSFVLMGVRLGHLIFI